MLLRETYLQQLCTLQMHFILGGSLIRAQETLLPTYTHDKTMVRQKGSVRVSGNIFLLSVWSARRTSVFKFSYRKPLISTSSGIQFPHKRKLKRMPGELASSLLYYYMTRLMGYQGWIIDSRTSFPSHPKWLQIKTPFLFTEFMQHWWRSLFFWLEFIASSFVALLLLSRE